MELVLAAGYCPVRRLYSCVFMGRSLRNGRQDNTTTCRVRNR